mmetsp:Transcript_4930/g.13783  ORF Transcript_4930/g.13783 Transcript_4930/m.13783 type:complete len:350 (+) Transcript_4930:91-1140(+)
MARTAESKPTTDSTPLVPQSATPAPPPEEIPKEKYRLPCDIYGLLLLRLVELASVKERESPPRAAKLKMFVAVMFYVVYCILAFGVMFFLMLVVSETMSRWEEDGFSDKHKKTMPEFTRMLHGMSRETSSDVDPVIVSTCEELHHVPRAYIYHLMIFLWTMRMWIEFKSARDWAMNMSLIETRTAASSASPLMSKDGCWIERVDRWIKAIILVFVVLVKIVICVLTLHIGCCFLMLQNSGFGIVLKVIAMQIVLGIDEQIIESLALREACKQLQDTAMKLSRRSAMMQKVYWYDGVGGIVFTALAALVTYYYTAVRFKDFMELRAACHMYLGQSSNFHWNDAVRTVFEM